ncbi:lipoprotein [Streptomyces sviceus ATCC 29083]|uniref:Lipoprotein n=1 Tax=Streptomyces sviceus (strain ATCC 29083 / DSM 924 / JCM 4929 / NBRC 13980 / NCIMB 11184 / NRRL 5439 / UC 5370) TaxID=463191 RepID=D6XBT5_STRX2|nr:lipoprotein [Streptomyces sviceus ATCC 29083]
MWRWPVVGPAARVGRTRVGRARAVVPSVVRPPPSPSPRWDVRCPSRCACGPSASTRRSSGSASRKTAACRFSPIAAHDRAGWYEHSPTPGQKGPSVILGHVTVGSYGDGVFRHLADLRKGDEIVARLQDGTSTVFAVTEVRTVAKADFPTKEVYGDVDRPELRLITCGGARTGDGYLDNVIVFAVLRSASP